MTKKIMVVFLAGMFFLGIANSAFALIQSLPTPIVSITVQKADGTPAANTSASQIKYFVQLYRIDIPRPTMHLIETKFTNSSGTVSFGGPARLLVKGTYVAIARDWPKLGGLSRDEQDALAIQWVLTPGSLPKPANFSLGTSDVSFTMRYSSFREDLLEEMGL